MNKAALALWIPCLILLGACGSIPQAGVFQKKTTGKNSILYGRFLDLPGRKFYTTVRFRNQVSGKILGFEIGQGFRVGTENAFAMILPPGRYELFSYVVENVGEFAHLSSAPAGPCEEVSVLQMDSNQFKVSRQYFWVDEKIDLKSLPDPMTEENAKRFRRSVITVPERSLVYIGDWVLRRISPLVSSNKDETDKVIAKRFPNLPTAEAITQLPEAEKDE